MNLAFGVGEDADGPVLVAAARRKDLLEEVRKWAVPEIVEERRGEGLAGALRRHALPVRKLVLDIAKPRDESLHHERRADGV